MMTYVSASILRKLEPLHSDPSFVDSFARVVATAAGSVCRVCGLGRAGHASESRWLGYEPHPWSGRPATADEVKRAGELTVLAYRSRRK